MGYKRAKGGGKAQRLRGAKGGGKAQRLRGEASGRRFFCRGPARGTRTHQVPPVVVKGRATVHCGKY
jgi:hypothetical protein